MHTRSTFSSILTYIGIGIVIVVFVGYVLFQARLLISGPRVQITEEFAVVQTERQITLIGTAKNITDITINGNPIVTDAEGNFSYTIVLENGYNKTSIRAHDRYGRETVLEKEFVYTPQSLLPS